jgi:hypothetical protein
MGVAIRDALMECGRMNTAVEAMREMLVQAMSETVEETNVEEMNKGERER